MADIVPLATEVKVPMVVGLANEPVAFDSCAVNIFPEVNVPVNV